MAKRRSKHRGKARAAKHEPHYPGTKAQPRPVSRSPALWIAIALAGAGLALTAYLSFLKWFGEHPTYCGAGSGCDLVQSSRWSTFLALPLAVWGFGMYAVLLGYLWRLRRKPSAWTRAWVIATFGFVMSVYLTLISVLEIEATCPYCLASFALISAIFAILTFTRPATLPNFRWSTWATGTLGAAGLIVATLHLHYSGAFDPAAGPEKPGLRALATHLSASGAIFYGAYWCPRCQDQKDAFEASADRLPYVECTPHGRGTPQSTACESNHISRYPTWVIDGKRHGGMLSPEALARLTEFKWEDPG